MLCSTYIILCVSENVSTDSIDVEIEQQQHTRVAVGDRLSAYCESERQEEKGLTPDVSTSVVSSISAIPENSTLAG